MATLREAVHVADSLGGVSWKLRAALSLAKLLRDQGGTSEAQQLLRSTYAQFHDGFDTQDLREARLLLADMAAG
jgi:predicted ATPase